MEADRRAACEKVLQRRADGAGYLDYLLCGYVRTHVTEVVPRGPVGVYAVSAPPGHGKTASARIIEVECVTSGRCIPAYAEPHLPRKALLARLAETFAERAAEVLAQRPGARRAAPAESATGALEFASALYCSGLCGRLPRVLLLVELPGAPPASLEAEFAEFAEFVAEVQERYCSPIGGIVLFGNWPHGEMQLLADALLRALGAGGRAVLFTEEHLRPLGGSARDFAYRVMRAYGLRPGELAVGVYEMLAERLPLAAANRLLHWLVRGAVPAAGVLERLSGLIEEEVAVLVGGRAVVLKGGRAVEVPGGPCFEVLAAVDATEELAGVAARSRRGCRRVAVAARCGGLANCVEIGGLDALALLDGRILEVGAARYGAALEEVARAAARAVAERVAEFVLAEARAAWDCARLRKLYEEDCRALNLGSRSEWLAGSKLVRALNGGKKPRRVEEVEEILAKYEGLLKECGVRLELRNGHILCW